MNLSFIVPAHNEEAWLGRSLPAIRSAMKGISEDYEIIVADDASTDSTAQLAARHGARVVRVAHRQISATRNSGARAARGLVLFFVDADTLADRSAIEEALRTLDEGGAGGGCVAQFEGMLPWWWRAVQPLFAAGVRMLRQPGGAFLFCTRHAFEAAGGFSEAHFAAEDAVFVRALKRQGRFVVLKAPVTTSGRNLRAQSPWKVMRLVARFALRGPDGFRSREGLDWWYRPRRP